jgi:hypothetical protein
MSRIRFVRPGRVLLEGRAWSGWPPVTRVEVTTDDCRSWHDAELGPPDRSGAHPWAWRRWQSAWPATPGNHVLAGRATDAAGRVQPLTQPWNRGGFGNNRIQRILVHCRPGQLG